MNCGKMRVTMAKASSKKSAVKRPVRHMKSDRVISPKVSVEEQQCDTMVGALAYDTQRMDWKWGIGRLEELVSTETAAKYGLAMARLNQAMDAHCVGDVSKWVESCRRGLVIMDAEALSRGHLALSTDVWEVEAEGIKFVLVRDGRKWQDVAERLPDARIITEREMVLALAVYKDSLLSDVVEAARQHFGAASEVTEIRSAAADAEIIEENGEFIF
jgi:uncharacterized protein (DUF1697 family)